MPANEPGGPAPGGALETVVAHCRPAPAIPAVLVFMLSVAMPAMMLSPVGAAGGSPMLWLIPAGILVSCGLAVAAGFCSLFPQTIWIALAGWSWKFTMVGPLPDYNRWALGIGIAACAAMLAVQLWRIVTGRFVPTAR